MAKQIARPLQEARKKTVASGPGKRFRYDDCHRGVKGAKEKLCRKFRRWKTEGQFCRNHSNKDGLAGWFKKYPRATPKKRRP